MFRFKPAELGVFNTEVAGKAIGGFRKGCRLIGLTRGKFSLIDLIRAILEHTGPAHVVCCTWSAGIKDAHQIRWLVDTRLIESFTIVTDRSYETRQAKYAIAIEDLFGKENIRVTDIHAKFVLIWNGDWKVTVRTSMNLNANRTCENFEIDEDEEIFDFYRGFIDKLLTEAPAGWDGRRAAVEAVLDRIFGAEEEEPREAVEPGAFLRSAIRRRLNEE